MRLRVEWGVSAGTHDASLCVMRNDKILFASHSERFSKKKNDKDLHPDMISYAVRKFGYPSKVYWYENPLTKATRKIYAGQKNVWLSPKQYMAQYDILCPVVWGNHHESHAAAGYYTSPFDDAAVLVIDAIGEWTTTSIWNNVKCVYKKRYPSSLGLFYSAITDRCELKPNEDEYILMGMAAYGDKTRFYARLKDLYDSGVNLHKGCWEKTLDIKPEDYFDLAASAQALYEHELAKLLRKTRDLTGKRNLVFMGGCALNCLANTMIDNYFDDHWIMPNPGDAGSSLGALLAAKKYRADWQTPYLGYDIVGDYPVDDLLEELLTNKIVGVANGRAEFGPRALGNRSLLADPRGTEMKDLVNKIKKRQEFRPFAPVVLEEQASEFFHVKQGFASPYMQHVVRCKFPEKFPAIVHKDGTSRVQTINKDQHAGLYDLMVRYTEATGCPILLNTSLNIKGMPMVNDKEDAKKFTEKYGVKVF